MTQVLMKRDFRVDFPLIIDSYVQLDKITKIRKMSCYHMFFNQCKTRQTNIQAGL